MVEPRSRMDGVTETGEWNVEVDRVSESRVERSNRYESEYPRPYFRTLL